MLQRRGCCIVQKVRVFLYLNPWKTPQKTIAVEAVGGSSRLFCEYGAKLFIETCHFALQGNFTAVFQNRLWAVTDHLLLMSKFSAQILGCAGYNCSHSERKQIKQGYQVWPIYFNQDI